MRRIRKGRPAASRPAHEAYHRAALTAGASLSGKGHLWPLGGHLSGKPRLILVHGTPTLNTLYWTEDRPGPFFGQMAEIAGMRAGDTIAFGHTHRPYPFAVQTLRWPFEDPAAEAGDEATRLAKFRAVRDSIERRVRAWLKELGLEARV